MENRKWPFCLGLFTALHGMNVWAGAGWERMEVPLIPRLQIVIHEGQAIALSGNKTVHRYADSLKAWMPGEELAVFSTLFQSARSAYLFQQGDVVPFPATAGQAPWPRLPSNYALRLAEDSIRQYFEFPEGELKYSDKAHPGWKSATATPWGGAFNSVVPLSDKLLAGSDSGLLVSVDRGATWLSSADLPRAPISIAGSATEGWFAFASAGGAYRSVDGLQWQPLFPGGSEWSAIVFEDVLVSGDTLWLTSFGDVKGVLRSLDQGKSWKWHWTGLPSTRVDSDDPSVPDRLIYQTGSIVRHGEALWIRAVDNFPYRSLDGGLTWIKTATGLEPWIGKIFPLWNKLYAALVDENGYSVWSFDASRNRWEKDEGLFPDLHRGMFEVAVSGDTAWLASDRFLYRNVRGTEQWEKRSTPWSEPVSTVQREPELGGIAVLGEEVFLLGWIPLEGVGAGNFHASEDGGASWQTQRPFFPTAEFQGSRVEARGKALWITDLSAPRRFRAWRAFPDSIRYLGATGGRLVVRSGSKVYSAGSPDEAWRETALPDTGMAMGILKDALAGMTPEAEWTSPDAGATWVSREVSFPRAAVRDFGVDDQGIWCLLHELFTYPEATGYVSDDYLPRYGFSRLAKTANRVLLGGEANPLEILDNQLRTVKKFSKADFNGLGVASLHASGDFLAIGIADGSLRISLDGGMSLAAHRPGLGLIIDMAGKPDGLMVLVAGKLFLSSDAGSSWENLPAPDSLALFDGEDGLLAGLTVRDTLVFSADGGLTWTREPSPFPTRECTALEVYAGAVYMGTLAQGIFRKSAGVPISVQPGSGPSALSDVFTGARQRLRRQGWLFGEGSETLWDLQGRKALP